MWRDRILPFAPADVPVGLRDKISAPDPCLHFKFPVVHEQSLSGCRCQNLYLSSIERSQAFKIVSPKLASICCQSTCDYTRGFC